MTNISPVEAYSQSHCQIRSTIEISQNTSEYQAQWDLLCAIYKEQLCALNQIYFSKPLENLIKSFPASIEQINNELDHLDINQLEFKLNQLHFRAQVLLNRCMLSLMVFFGALLLMPFLYSSWIVLAIIVLNVVVFLAASTEYLHLEGDLLKYQKAERALSHRFFDRDQKYNAEEIKHCLQAFDSQQNEMNQLVTSTLPPFI